MKDRIGKLVQVAATLRESELAELARREATRRQLAAEAEAVREAGKAGLRQDGQCNPVSVANALRFQEWVAARQQQIATELAQAAAAAEDQKAAAIRAFGRALALERVQARLARPRR